MRSLTVTGWLQAGLAALSIVPTSLAHPVSSGDILRRSEISKDELLDSYDFIVVGGGQAGTVIATRLTENPDISVLVVEFGYFNNDPSHLGPNGFDFSNMEFRYNISSAPQKGLNGRSIGIFAACCVGGGSTINGMMLNRGSAADYDAWEELGNDGWGWDDLYPYFVKHSHFDAPSEAAVKEYGMTWGEESYGDGPIHQSFSSWQWPGTLIQRKGMIAAGAEPNIDGSGGDAHGLIWYPTALDNATAARSYAVNGYYKPAAGRSNLHVLTGWRVDEIQIDEYKRATGVKLTKRDNLDQSKPETAKASSKREIIVTAGAVHTPQVLQRSGIGPKWLLDEAGIEVLVDLPGVGSNLQDHANVQSNFDYKTNVLPNPAVSLTDPEFAEWARKEFEEHRSGPLRIGTGNTGGLVPFPVVDPENFAAITEEYLAQNAAEFLPETYSAEQLAGYEAMRKVQAKQLTTPDNAWLEVPLTASTSLSTVLMKCVSRGTVLLNTTDIYAAPILNYNTLVNPIDVKILTSHVRFVRRMHETEEMKQLGPVPVSPGPDVKTDEQIETFLRASTGSSIAHNVGSAVMMPRELGGVVDAQLKVYGVRGLSVADASIMPLVPATHTCSTVYAIAEKAADIIKKRHCIS
ncbi:GMC oxidoreductase [Colletotrichum truncatum]|uniref:GMC oxidoreductase n=1 Tax=Colletotrichum truncatum TaxID=5467 RepID=A0ACC3YH89_COLTU|nr:GMC oxidoreductase [Colletotrichum truncatum]KAF6792823.1 GMC oxidoreductase [Colletotrichum truncatum]